MYVCIFMYVYVCICICICMYAYHVQLLTQPHNPSISLKNSIGFTTSTTSLISHFHLSSYSRQRSDSYSLIVAKRFIIIVSLPLSTSH